MQPQTGAPAPVTPPMGPPMAQPPMGQPPMQPAPQIPFGQSPQPMQPMAPQKKWFNNKYSKWLFVAIFAVVGGLATYLIFAQTNTGTQYFWSSQRYQPTYWDGQVHTDSVQCQYFHFVCHDNGKLISAGKGAQFWQSDPKNNSSKKLTSATWHGPYDYSSGPYSGYGFGVTGNQEACFYLKDAGSGNARVTLRVQNLSLASTQPQNLYTKEFTLGKDFKKNFVPKCVQYFNSTNAVAQQYNLYVMKGTVQISYVDHLTEYFTYDYNPYPYDYFSKTILSQSSSGAKSHSTTAICSVKLSKSTARCLSANDLSAATSNNGVTDVQLNPTDAD